VADFHGVGRHGFISAIVAGGASVKVAQELARHSTPNLTIGRYSHTRLHDLETALDSLPSFTGPETGEDQAALQATGTDDDTATEVGQRWAQIWAHPSGETGRNPVESNGSPPPAEEDEGSPQVVFLSGVGKREPHLARGDESSGAGTRTPDTRIMIPLL
jgi:hypothetical protein